MPGEAACRGCGRPIIWAVTANAKKIPLDARAVVYRLHEGAVGAPQAIKATDVYVSHFSTCPKADQFSGGGRV